jgi:hypothetical protein
MVAKLQRRGHETAHSTIVRPSGGSAIAHRRSPPSSRRSLQFPYTSLSSEPVVDRPDV